MLNPNNNTANSSNTASNLIKCNPDNWITRKGSNKGMINQIIYRSTLEIEIKLDRQLENMVKTLDTLLINTSEGFLNYETQYSNDPNLAGLEPNSFTSKRRKSEQFKVIKQSGVFLKSLFSGEWRNDGSPIYTLTPFQINQLNHCLDRINQISKIEALKTVENLSESEQASRKLVKDTFLSKGKLSLLDQVGGVYEINYDALPSFDFVANSLNMVCGY